MPQHASLRKRMVFLQQEKIPVFTYVKIPIFALKKRLLKALYVGTLLLFLGQLLHRLNKESPIPTTLWFLGVLVITIGITINMQPHKEE